MTKHIDSAPAQDAPKKIAELQREIERLNQEHKLRVRRIEIESYKAETMMAQMLRQMRAQPSQSCLLEEAKADNQRLAAEIARLGLQLERSTVEKILFRRDGQPRQPLLMALFTKAGEIALFARRIVLGKNGLP